MKYFLQTLAIVTMLSACSSAPKAPHWLVYSNQVAQEFTRDYSKLFPELGSGLGHREFDKLGNNPGAKTEHEYKSLVHKWVKRLEDELALTKDKNLIVDFNILLQNTKRNLRSIEINEKLGVISIPKASQNVYGYLFQLINEQSPRQRKRDAVERFKYYMSENKKKGKYNLIEAYRREIIRHKKKYQKYKSKVYPFRGEVEKYLADSPFFVKGVGELLAKSGREDWKQDYQSFKAAIDVYDNFIRNKILPLARKKPMLPLALYKLALESYGVSASPRELIKRGKKEYKKLYRTYKKLAAKIATKNKLSKNTPAYVVSFMKTKQITRKDAAEKLYHQAANRLTEIIRKHNLVTLPKTPLKIRMAGDAESKAAPVPHLVPPPLIDNDGVVPEFVVPTSSTGQVPFDDFSFASAATILTAHEGRPGHDLQFTRMLESPTSIIRARYAMNSVNVEGWALYAEDLVYPYLTLEEKFAGIQMRLWREARYFLDPMVQLGKATVKDVIRVFNQELGVSQNMALLEFQRYAFSSPGQATAYFQGYLNILKIKKDLTKEYGKMQTKCFNDTLLSFGLLPHKDILLFKDDFKKCAAHSSL